MKKIVITFLALVTALSLSAAAYSDVPESYWASGEIEVCTENGIFEGFPDGSFRPSDVMTREDATTALTRQFENTDFSDYLSSNDKNGAITREEATYLIAKAKGYENTDEFILDKFSDKEKISEKYKEGVSAAVEAGIVSPVVVIVAALTGICSFVIPNVSIVSGLRISKYLVIGMAAVFGMFGVWAALLLLLGHLASLTSYGIPYLYPYCSSSINHDQDWEDSVFRLPLSKMKGRPIFVRRVDRKEGE